MTEDIDGVTELGAAAAAELAASALAQRGAAKVACKNCGAPLIGPYCAACGQERETHRRKFWNLLHDFFENLFSFDSRLLRTAGALMTRPGELTAAFREGRTRRYVPALRLYLFTTLLFFILLSLSGIALMQFEVVVTGNVSVRTDAETGDVVVEIQKPKEDLPPEVIEQARERGIEFREGPDGSGAQVQPAIATKVHFFAPIGTVRSTIPEGVRSALAEEEKKVAAEVAAGEGNPFLWRLMQGLSNLADDPAALNGPLNTWIPRVLFLLLPAFALLLVLFYVRQRKAYYFIDHMVFSLNVHTFVFVVLILAAFSAQVVPADIVGWLTLAIVLVYLLFAMRNFYAQNWFWTGTKFALVTALYFLFFLAPALVIVLILSMAET